ncbi:RNA 2',3'-cyclic phosphodiesterase [Paenibacillus sp. Marseille-Q4541]|uniref:RNA 2',3'-cyclic phosphodiesterase n=1 Tax=Paenibacillus sp. Marseille-Q4541 TaxID=2831522 RepID=UPI001BA786A6|nr:RNA 2',3'-cyclic phosphodiesterase [Paenibacillus sp. Marseille-Q4541]
MTSTSHRKARVFTAITLPEHAKKEIQKWIQLHKNKLPFRNFTHREDYHITLQFLGDTEVSEIPKLCDALRGAATQLQAFPLGIGEPGIFGSSTHPRVLWRGVEGELDQLSTLFEYIVKSTLPLGYIPEDRPYRPHITVARKFDESQKMTWNLDEIMSHETLDTWLVEGFVLYQTYPGQKPMYKVIENFDF